MSADFEVMWVRPVGLGEAGKGRKFDEGYMEDIYAGVGSGPSGGGVMCTVEFGLILVRKTSCPDQQQPYTGDTRNGHGSSSMNGTANGHAMANGMTNGNGHAPMANGHAKMNGAVNGNGVGSSGPRESAEGGKVGSLTRTVLVKSRVLLDSVSQLV